MLNGVIEATNGKKTYLLAGLQALATFGQLAGFVTADQLAVLSQAVGVLFALTLGHKVVRGD